MYANYDHININEEIRKFVEQIEDVKSKYDKK